MRTFFFLMSFIAGCATQPDPMLARAPAQVGIVNHTGNFIYSASVDGQGGAPMGKWGAGLANFCCASIFDVWHPGIYVLVRWDMPEGHKHIAHEKIVVLEKYDEPGDIYLHFFPDDQVRVVVSNYAGFSKHHPILPPLAPGNESNSSR